MFQVGEYVVYGNNGICNVADISTLDMEGVPKDRLYYALSPKANDRGTVYVPVDNPKIVIRRIMTREDVMELLQDAPSIEPIEIKDDKLREERYRECIRSCESREWMRVIKTIYVRKQWRIHHGKKITATDERYMKQAEDHLYSELSTVLDIPRNEVPDMIKEKIGQ